jgi:hypothetical protein
MTGQNERPLRPAAALVVGIGRQPDGRVTIGLAAFAKEGDPLGLLLPPAALAHDLVDTIEEGGTPLEGSRARWRVSL